MDDDEFLAIGAAAREAKLINAGNIAQASTILVPMPALVDLAVERWQGGGASASVSQYVVSFSWAFLAAPHRKEARSQENR